MPEQVKFKSARVWRAPLLRTAQKHAFPQRRLRITHPDYGITEAVFEKQCGVWSVTQTDRRLHWLKNKLANDVRIILQSEGATWEWI